ncbi:uridine kinase family-domain-containing protein [Jimgerdemannia flammicorona]|uniref:uridine/cytidine kinase n=1 Tax=Jimgerdemannia flammicorona TaxID=994334 RepID=A0A433CYJ8_9FUNG|nr:uridine kinase family-domain-containing protein [Jimgerdemannia flammicorona]
MSPTQPLYSNQHNPANMSIDPTKIPSNPKFFDVGPVEKAPFIIGVAGGPASGKKTVCKMIMERLNKKYDTQVKLISLQDFYRELTVEEKELADQGEFDFDHPSAFDFALVEEIIGGLLAGQTVHIPSYNFQTRKRNPTSRTLAPPDVILFEGILLLYPREILDLLSMKLFVDVDSDERLARRVIQDSGERYHLPIEKILNQYVRFVKPSFEEFIQPTKKYADIIIPRGANNLPAIDLIANHIDDLLKGRASSTNVRSGSRTGSRTGSRSHSPTVRSPTTVSTSGLLRSQSPADFVTSPVRLEYEEAESPLGKIKKSTRRQNSAEVLGTKTNLFTPVPQ